LYCHYNTNEPEVNLVTAEQISRDATTEYWNRALVLYAAWLQVNQVASNK
jgi:hypothetical protein